MPLIRAIVGSSPRSTHGEKDGYESPISKDREIGQDANCTRDLAALAERKTADANADGPHDCQQPHDCEIRNREERQMVCVRKDRASRANERKRFRLPP